MLTTIYDFALRFLLNSSNATVASTQISFQTGMEVISSHQRFTFGYSYTPLNPILSNDNAPIGKWKRSARVISCSKISKTGFICHYVY